MKARAGMQQNFNESKEGNKVALNEGPSAESTRGKKDSTFHDCGRDASRYPSVFPTEGAKPEGSS